jgi:hypothetical protein
LDHQLRVELVHGIECFVGNILSYHPFHAIVRKFRKIAFCGVYALKW